MGIFSGAARLLETQHRRVAGLARLSRRTLLTRAAGSLGLLLSSATSVIAASAGAMPEAAVAIGLGSASVICPLFAMVARRSKIQDFFTGPYQCEEKVQDRYSNLIERARRDLSDEKY